MDPERGVSRRAVLGGVAAAMAGGGCLASGLSPEPRASDWLQPGYDAGGTRFKSAVSPPVDDAETAWIADVETDGQTGRGEVLIANGTVYTDGGVALSLDDGSVTSRSQCLENRLRAFVRTESYRSGVVIASDVESVQGIRPSLKTFPNDRCAGSVRWTAGAPNDLTIRVRDYCVVDDRLFVSGDVEDRVAHLLGIDVNDGRIKWRERLDRFPEQVRSDGSHLYAYSQRPADEPGRLSVIDIDSTETIQTVETHSRGKLHAVRNGIAYLTDYVHEAPLDSRAPESDDYHSPHLVAVDVSTGTVQWELSVNDYNEDPYVSGLEDDHGPSRGYAGGIGGLAVGPDAVFAALGFACVSVSVDDGSVNWTRDVIADEVAATPETLYIYDDEAVKCLDTATGETRWTYPIQRAPLLESPLLIGDSKVLVPDERRLVALEEA